MTTEDKASESAELPKGEEKGQAQGGAPADAPDKGSPDTGTEFAEFKDPKEAARFKRVYGHVKRNERIIATMAQDNKVLFEATQKYADRLANLEKTIAEKGTSDSLSWLQAERKNAIEAGDLARVSDISDKIAEVKVKIELGKVTGAKKPAAPVQMTRTQQEQDFLGSELRDAFTDWAAEKDRSGNLLRPWAQTGHPKFRRAVEHAAAVLNDPDFQNEDSGIMLREVDRLMGFSKQTTQAVLSGKNEDGVQVKAPKLSAEQLAVAKKMGVKPEKYAEQMARYKRA